MQTVFMKKNQRPEAWHERPGFIPYLELPLPPLSIERPVCACFDHTVLILNAVGAVDNDLLTELRDLCFC